MAGFFGFFDYTKEGRGVYPDDPPKGPIVTFFAILGRKFWKIVQINLMYILFSLPALLVSLVLATLAFQWLFPGLTVESLAVLIKETGAVLNEGVTYEAHAASQLLLIYGIFGLLLTGLALVVAGPVHAGFTYVLRNYAREEHAFIWMDFKEHFGKNFKQSILASIISLVVTVILFFNLSFYLNTALDLGFFRPMLVTLLVLIFIFHCFCQMYLYPMMITFELSLKQLYKNCILFGFLRLPINFALLVVSLMVLMGIPLLMFFIGSGLSFLLVFIYYLFLAFGINLLMTNFFVYRGLDKYMIQKIQNADVQNQEAVSESPADQTAGQTEEEPDQELVPQES